MSAVNSTVDNDIQQKLVLAKSLLRTELAKKKISVIESYLDRGGFGGISPRVFPVTPIPTWNPDIYTDRSKTIRYMQQLYIAQNLSQDLAESNPNAIATINGLKRHVVGQGSTFQIISNDEDADPPPQLANKLKQLLKGFNKCNKWSEIEKEMVYRLHVHGEFFLEIWPDEENIGDVPYVEDTVVSFIEPQMIQPPPGQNWDGPWSWGILYDTRSAKPISYNVHSFREGTDRQVPAAFVIHRKINTLRNVKRGIPTFFTCSKELLEVEKLRSADRQGNIIRSLIAFIRLYDDNTSATSLNALADEDDNANLDLNCYNGSPSQLVNPFRVEAPSIVTTNAKEIQGPPPASNQAGVTNAVDQALQAVAAAFGVPEWVPSGKSDVGSYAASLQTGSPFLLTIDENQAILVEAVTDCYCRVAEIAIEQGLLSENTLEQCGVHVAYPDNVVRNKKEESDIQLDLWDRGILDTASVLSKQGYDPEQIMAKLLEDPIARPDQSSQPAKPTLSSTSAAQYQRET